jgi:hypothetical protein
VRERDIIDAELRLLVSVKRSARDHGVEPGCHQIDELLDERSAGTGQPHSDRAMGASASLLQAL